MTEDTVQVYVYDLSQGLARVYSPMLLGILIDAIYHTSVVIRNKEYYLDQGIKVNSPPGHTKYGTPIEVLNLEGRILKLPDTVLNTPNGQLLQQMLGQNFV